MKGFLPHDLGRLLNALNLKLVKVLRPMDLSIQQFRVLQVLAARDMTSIGEICRDTVIEQSVVSRLVDQLEQRGFAIRRKRPTNARVVEVTMTPVGQAVYQAVQPHAIAIVDQALGVVSPEERGVFFRVLSQLYREVSTEHKA